MNVPEDLMYTRQHEWILVDEDTATVGITDYAQQELGDVVYVELPETGSSYGADEAFGSVESVKAVSEIYLPVAGQVTAVNTGLEEAPEIVNQDPYGKGWMVRVRLEDPSEVDLLMTSDEYIEYLEELSA